jgi:GTP-binding protein
VTSRSSGTLVSMENGTATAYALDTLQERGKLFIGPGDEVYVGMIVGENARAEDIPVNPTREKQLTNMRSTGPTTRPSCSSRRSRCPWSAPSSTSPPTSTWRPPRKSLRLRKKILDPNKRKRSNQRAEDLGG